MVPRRPVMLMELLIPIDLPSWISPTTRRLHNPQKMVLLLIAVHYIILLSLPHHLPRLHHPLIIINILPGIQPLQLARRRLPIDQAHGSHWSIATETLPRTGLAVLPCVGYLLSGIYLYGSQVMVDSNLRRRGPTQDSGARGIWLKILNIQLGLAFGLSCRFLLSLSCGFLKISRRVRK